MFDVTGLSGDTWLQALLLRTLPALFFFAIGVPALFVSLLDFGLENFDWLPSACVDGASELTYNYFDKLFDSFYIVTLLAYALLPLLCANASRTVVRNYRYWRYAVAALGLFRLIGIGLFFITGDALYFIIFPNFVVPYFVYVSLARYFGLYNRQSFAAISWLPTANVVILILIAVYKIIEEILHHTNPGIYEWNRLCDYVNLENNTRPPTHKDIYKQAMRMIPIFFIFIFIALEPHVVRYRRDALKKKLKR